ncbi:GNAT family N-acetyltransferase [Sinomicrobium sp. M5D2P17]
MDVSVRDRNFRVFHTVINPGYEGRGFAKLLLDQLVRYARENNLMIIPLGYKYNRNPNTIKGIIKKNSQSNF